MASKSSDDIISVTESCSSQARDVGATEAGGMGAPVTEPVVRRPMNAFLIFCKRHRTMVRERHPSLDNRSITKILGEWWTKLDKKEKIQYVDLAKQYKEAFLRANPGFRWHNEKSAVYNKPCTRPSNTRPDSDSSPEKIPDMMGHEDWTPGESPKLKQSSDHSPPNAALLQLAMMCTSELYHQDGDSLDPASVQYSPARCTEPPDKFDSTDGPESSRTFHHTESSLAEPLKCNEEISTVDARMSERHADQSQKALASGSATQPEVSQSESLFHDDEDEYFSEAPRKSQRRNRGKKYQELIEQGIIRHKSDKRKEGEQLSQSLSAIDMQQMRRRHLSEPVNQPCKFNSSDFDLDAHIAELPVCNLDLPVKRTPKRKRNQDSCSSLTDSDSVSLETSYDRPLEPEEVSGSRKRKARRRTITHLVPQSPTSHLKVPAEWLHDQNQNAVNDSPANKNDMSCSRDYATANQNTQSGSRDDPSANQNTDHESHERDIRNSKSSTNEEPTIGSRDTTSTDDDNGSQKSPIKGSHGTNKSTNHESDSEDLIIEEGPKTPPGEKLIRQLEFQGEEMITVGFVDSLPTNASKSVPTKRKREQGAASARLFRQSMHIDGVRPRSAGSMPLKALSQRQTVDMDRVKVDLSSRFKDPENISPDRLRCTEEVGPLMRGVRVAFSPIKYHDMDTFIDNQLSFYLESVILSMVATQTPLRGATLDPRADYVPYLRSVLRFKGVLGTRLAWRMLYIQRRESAMFENNSVVMVTVSR